MDKFKIDGHDYRKYNTPYSKMNALSIPLTAYGKASAWNVISTLIVRQFCSNLIMKRLFLKLGLIPLFCIFMYTFILPSLDETQNSFQTRSYIIFNLMAAITLMTPIITSYYCKWSSQSILINNKNFLFFVQFLNIEIVSMKIHHVYRYIVDHH